MAWAGLFGEEDKEEEVAEVGEGMAVLSFSGELGLEEELLGEIGGVGGIGVGKSAGVSFITWVSGANLSIWVECAREMAVVGAATTEGHGICGAMAMCTQWGASTGCCGANLNGFSK